MKPQYWPVVFFVAMGVLSGAVYFVHGPHAREFHVLLHLAAAGMAVLSMIFSSRYPHRTVALILLGLTIPISVSLLMLHRSYRPSPRRDVYRDLAEVVPVDTGPAEHAPGPMVIIS